MRILILGGGLFLGRHLAAAALGRGHAVTLFNRGQHAGSDAGAAGDGTLEIVIGERRRDLGRLAGRAFDACIDTSGYVPSQLAAAAAALASTVGHYTFVSTLSVYADATGGRFDESAPLATIAPDELARTETLDPQGPVPTLSYGQHYGALKGLCEAEATRAWPDRCLVVRPGLIVGPFDPTDRFTYWPARIAASGDVLAPGAPWAPLRLIDVRDLAGWMLAMIERRQTGVFNATGAATALGTILDACRAVANHDARLVWVPDDFLLRERIVPWSGIPLWVPATIDPGAPLRAESTAALERGLALRPLAETIAATLDWDRARSPYAPRRTGLPRARERALLDAWQAVAGDS